jgi:hypothetical protein
LQALTASVVSLPKKTRKPSLDKVIQIAAKQKENIVKTTLNNTQKLVNECMVTLQNETKLSNHSSAVHLQIQRASLGTMAKFQDSYNRMPVGRDNRS